MKLNRSLAVLVPLALAASAGADEEILSLGFQDGNASGWTANGVATIFETDGNPDAYLGIPYMDFFGVQLSAREESSQVFGDLTRYGSALRISFDVRVFAIDNFDGMPIDPSNYPLVMQMWNYDIPADGVTSVYLIGPTLPAVEDGWVHMSWIIPDPTSATLPAGWGGTGSEDPNTFEPMLPPGVTYADVLAGVDQLDFTTFVPGYFYGFNFWQVGWDNLVIETVSGNTCAADFNGDGFLDFFDYDDYVNCFESGNCPEGRTADFNGDDFVDFFDYDDYVSAFETGC